MQQMKLCRIFLERLYYVYRYTKDNRDVLRASETLSHDSIESIVANDKEIRNTTKNIIKKIWN